MATPAYTAHPAARPPTNVIDFYEWGIRNRRLPAICQVKPLRAYFAAMERIARERMA